MMKQASHIKIGFKRFGDRKRYKDYVTIPSTKKLYDDFLATRSYFNFPQRGFLDMTSTSGIYSSW